MKTNYQKRIKSPDKLIKQLVDLYNEWNSLYPGGGTGYYKSMYMLVTKIKNIFDTWQWK